MTTRNARGSGPPNDTTQVSQGDIEAGLRRIGVRAGDTLLLHSSLKSFGHVRSGAEAVIAALQAVLGPRGTLVMPTLTLGMDEQRAVFDVSRSPSTSGKVTDVFRCLPGVHRSHHPFSSAAVWGWAAEEMVGFHDGLPCSLTSPYGQVYLRGGCSLFMGAPLTSNSMFHVAEEIEKPRYLRYAVFPDSVVIDERGCEHRVTSYRYNCHQTGVRRQLGRMEAVFHEAGVLSELMVGQSRWRLVWARDNVSLSREVIRSRPEFILEDSLDH